MKMLIWVALAAMAPGTARAMRALISGVRSLRSMSAFPIVRHPRTGSRRRDRPSRDPMPESNAACEVKVTDVSASAPPKAPNIGR